MNGVCLLQESVVPPWQRRWKILQLSGNVKHHAEAILLPSLVALSRCLDKSSALLLSTLIQVPCSTRCFCGLASIHMPEHIGALFGRIDGTDEGNKTYLNQCHLFLIKPT